VATVDMWFDPMCPWAWLTSRWLLEVEQVRDVKVRFHVMSLAVLNESADGWGPVRVACLVGMRHGAEGLRTLFDSVGRFIHGERAPIGRDTYARALSRSGLPHTLANAATTTFYDDAVRSSHRRGAEPLGRDAGSPIVHLPGRDGEPTAFFGPVVTPAPRREAAGKLWDAGALAAATDGFFELKRHRDRSPDRAG
jgi:hypothetical protein